MTSVWQSTVTEAWATVTATDNANPITGEQRVMRNEDAYALSGLFIKDAEETIVYRLSNLHSQDKSIR